ncbi:uncharacterized protein LOC126237222 [Schistocerca nitens]|uniref:uncharacterized protein LOC126237222 n=1 Tax=Schistocerca nitens TaxID=7011 RepID=UPI0021181E51|nr:uncharacterized protein LOC126237222 [Schistocerca nitens]
MCNEAFHLRHDSSRRVFVLKRNRSQRRKRTINDFLPRYDRTKPTTEIISGTIHSAPVAGDNKFPPLKAPSNDEQPSYKRKLRNKKRPLKHTDNTSYEETARKTLVTTEPKPCSEETLEEDEGTQVEVVTHLGEENLVTATDSVTAETRNKKRRREHTDDHADEETSRKTHVTRKPKLRNRETLEEDDGMRVEVVTHLGEDDLVITRESVTGDTGSLENNHEIAVLTAEPEEQQLTLHATQEEEPTEQHADSEVREYAEGRSTRAKVLRQQPVTTVNTPLLYIDNSNANTGHQDRHRRKQKSKRKVIVICQIRRHQRRN